MLRKFALLLAAVSFCALAAFMVACGSSSGHSTTQCTGTYDVVGDWNLTLNGAAGDGGVIDTTGLALFFDSFGDVVSFPSLTGACSFSGTATLYETEVGGGASGTASIQGNVSSTTSISGTATTTTGSSPFTIAPFSPLSGSVGAISASMLASIEDDPDADIWEITVTATGTGAGMTFTGPNTSDTCTISGTFTQEGTASANLNVFSTSISFSGASCAYTGTTTGLGFESSSDDFGFSEASGTYLYSIASNAAVVLEIYPTGEAARQLRNRAHRATHPFSF